MSDQDVLRVYDAATGKELWTFSDGTTTQLITAPTVRDGVAYLGTTSETESVVALDAKTGDRVWTRGGNRIGAVYGTPTLGADGHRLYIAAQAQLFALDAKTGETRWHKDVFGSIKNTLAVRSPLVVATTSAGEVYAFKENGEALWRRQFSGGSGSSSPPTLSDRWIFVGCNNYVYCLEPVSGSVRWKKYINRLYLGGLVATDSSVYATSGGGVVALGGRNGDRQWSVGLGTSVSCAPMIIDDTLYVGGPSVVALKLPSGYSIAALRSDSTRWSENVGSHVGPGMAASDERLFAPVQMSDGTAELVGLEAT